jgi:hypothetical protein
MFQIKIADPDMTSGMVPVTWCISPDLLKVLAKLEINNPQVIISVIPENCSQPLQKEHRYVVPLRDLMTYVEFRTPGINRIFATLSLTDLSVRDCKKKFLRRTDGGYYDWDIATFDGKEYNEDSPNNAEPVVVDVPQGAFAPEPAAWEKAWVNHFYETSAVDQCHFRQRRLFAYSLQPFLILLGYIPRLAITLVALLTVQRNFSLKHLIHPLLFRFFEGLDMFEEGSRLISKKDVGFVRKYAGCLLAPPIYLWALLCYLIPGLIIITLAGLLLGLAVFIVICLIAVAANASELRDELERFLDRKKSTTSWAETSEEIQDLVCVSQKPITGLASLPAKKKTIKLRFYDLKSKVCRPFAG